MAVLAPIGLIVPRLEAPEPTPHTDVEIVLLPPFLAAGAAPALAARAARRPGARAAVASPLAGTAAPQVLATVEPALPAPAEGEARSDEYPGFFRGAVPGCGLEDLALLTPADKLRCRNQLEVEFARRAARAADADRARRLRDATARPVDGLPPEKRAYYDAVIAARRQARDTYAGEQTLNQVIGRRGLSGTRNNIDVNVSVRCGMKFGANKGAPAGPRFGLKLGPLSCPLAPPPGFLTEEARVTPP